MRAIGNCSFGSKLLTLVAWRRHNWVAAASGGYILSPILDEDMSYNLSSPLPDDIIILESPLYCPRQDFISICQTPLCSESTLQLLRNLRDVIDVFEQECTSDPTSKPRCIIERQAITGRFKALPSITDPNQEIFADNVHESCRLAAEITLRAIESRTFFSAAAAVTALLPDLAAALRKTDLSDMWGHMAGVLFWVVLTGQVASKAGKPEWAFMGATHMRSLLYMCYVNPYREVAIDPVKKFVRLHQGL